MLERLADGETRRLAARVACGFGAVAVVAVAAPVVQARAVQQTESHEWRLTARAFLESYDDSEDVSGDSRYASLVSRRAGERGADRDAWSPFQTFTPVHFQIASRQSREIDCLATAIFYESRNESMMGQLAVAEVILNRVRHRLYPNNVCDVVYEGTDRSTGLSIYGTRASCQFSFTCDGSEVRRPRSGPSWETAQRVAAHAFLGLSGPVTDDATHYHANYVSPFWAPRLVHTRTIGTHIFYRFPTSEEARGRRGA